MRTFRNAVVVGGALVAVAVSGTAAVAADGPDRGGNRSWQCSMHAVCLFSDTDGDGRLVEVINLPPDCRAVEIPRNSTLSVRNRNPYRVQLTGAGAGSLDLRARERKADLVTPRQFRWAARNDC